MKINKELHKKYKSSGEILFNLENYDEINFIDKIKFKLYPEGLNKKRQFFHDIDDDEYYKRFIKNFEEFIYIQYGEGEYDSYIIKKINYDYMQIIEYKKINVYSYIKILYNIYLKIHKKNNDEIDPYENPFIYDKIAFGVYISNLQDDFE